MKCPECRCRTRVRNTRDLGEVVLRHRFCPGCGHVFKTAERYDWLRILETIQAVTLDSLARTEEQK